jgi:hypothetical protein
MARLRSTGLLLGIQCLFAGGLVAVMPFLPSDKAPVLLVPFDGEAAGSLAGAAIASGSLILSPGPLAGSLVVKGQPARLRRALGQARVLMLAAPPAICGSGQ